MKSMKKVIATAMTALVLTLGSAAVYAHTCTETPPPGCFVDHAVGDSGIHYCITMCPDDPPPGGGGDS